MADTDAIQASVAHRPWPLPEGPWVMFQSWRNLLFAHWRISAKRLRPLIPPQLEIEEFDGSAWLGQTPFLLAGLHIRHLPRIPGFSEFPEMNLRTYVRFRDKAGIFFFTLEAASWIVVVSARLGYSLPYHHADMQITHEGNRIHYRSHRTAADAEFDASYEPVGKPRQPELGTLEHFLTERYALFTLDPFGRVVRGDIHHRPWLISEAQAELRRNTIPAAHGIHVPDEPPRLHFSVQQDSLIWLPRQA